MMKAYEIPEYGRTAKGIPVINLLDISADENSNSDKYSCR